MSRLDYSIGLLYGLPKCTVSGFQAAQNSAARIVTHERLRDHDSMSRALIGLHWFPVDKMVECKLLLYMYKALHGLAPGYLCELGVPYVPRKVLMPAELNFLTVPQGKPGKYGSRGFARASAKLWNSLMGETAACLKNSPTFDSFKRNLKTYIFWERFSGVRSATFSTKVYHCILLVSLYVIHVLWFVRYVYYIILLEFFRV